MSWIENLEHRYSDFRVSIPKWEILDSGITVLWGPSGSGKSTILRLLLGLEPGKYSWSLGGEDIGKLSLGEKRLGIVFQSYDLFPHLSGFDNVEFALAARKIRGVEAAQRLKDLSEKLALEMFWHRKARLLSGGEQQRIALARALIARPRALLLDEPFSALDEPLRREARQHLLSVISAEGIPAILITHDRDDVRELAAKVSVLKAGEIVRETTADGV
jgi:sulfate transport system ATP-binding protein/putative spermidine/putrescine transport system ATP-binding protein